MGNIKIILHPNNYFIFPLILKDEKLSYHHLIFVFSFTSSLWRGEKGVKKTNNWPERKANRALGKTRMLLKVSWYWAIIRTFRKIGESLQPWVITLICDIYFSAFQFTKKSRQSSSFTGYQWEPVTPQCDLTGQLTPLGCVFICKMRGRTTAFLKTIFSPWMLLWLLESTSVNNSWSEMDQKAALKSWGPNFRTTPPWGL